MERHNISGIYIFDKFPGEDQREPTCFEDCQEETQDKWLNSLSPEALKNLSKQLAQSLKKIATQFEIYSE